MTFLGGALHEPGYARTLFGGDERAHLHALFLLRAKFDAARGAREIGDELVVDFGAGVDAARGSAILPCVVEAESAHASDHGLEVGIIEHDDGRLAAELQVRSLGAVDRGRQHLLAADDRAGQRDHGHFGLRDERRTHGVPAAADDVDDAWRKQLRAYCRQFERGERRLLGRFEHHGVARGQCRPHLPGSHHEWIVPRRDRSDHAQGIAANHAGETRKIFAGQCAVHRASSPGEETKHVGDRGYLVVQRGVQWFAAILRFEARKFHGLPLDAVCQFQQQRAAVFRDRRRPAGKGFRRGFHGGGDLFFGRFGHLRDDFTGSRIQHPQLVTLAFDQLAVNEQFRVHRRAS